MWSYRVLSLPRLLKTCELPQTILQVCVESLTFQIGFGWLLLAITQLQPFKSTVGDMEPNLKFILYPTLRGVLFQFPR